MDLKPTSDKNEEGIRTNPAIFVNPEEKAQGAQQSATKPKSNVIESIVEQLQKQKQPLSVGNDTNYTSRDLNTIDDDNDIEFLGEKTNEKSLQPSRGTQEIESEDKNFDLTVAKFQCQFCHESLLGIYNLNTHLRRVHKAKVELTCNLCGKTFHKNRNLINHLEEHRTNPDKFSSKSSRQRAKRGRKKSYEPNTTKSKTQQKTRENKNKAKKKHKKSKPQANPFKTGRGRRKRGKQSHQGTNRGGNDDISEMLTSPIFNMHNVNSASVDKPSASTKISADKNGNETGNLSNNFAPPFPPSPLNEAHEDDWGWDIDFKVSENNPSGLGPSVFSVPVTASVSSFTSKHKIKCDVRHDTIINNDSVKQGIFVENLSPLPFPCSKCPLRFRTGDLLHIHQTYHDLLILVKFRCERFSCSRYFDHAADYQKHFILRHFKSRRHGSLKKLFRAKATYPCKYGFKKSKTKSEALSHSAIHVGRNLGPKTMYFADKEIEDSELQYPLEDLFQSGVPELTPDLEIDKDLVAIEINEDLEEGKGKDENADHVIKLGNLDVDPDLKPVIRKTLNGKSLRTKLMPVKRYGVSKKPEAVSVPISPHVYRGTSNDCPVCTKTCRTLVDLDFHMSAHAGCKPFPCSNCSMKFSKLSLLRRHVTSAHAFLRSFSCPQCPDKSFSKRHDLRRHIAYHNRTCTFICPTCGKAFKRNGHLREHIARKHTQERPFVCSEPNCTSAFLTPSELRRHARSHESPVGLKKKTVLGVAPKTYECKYCDKPYVTRGALRKHISRLHGDTPKPLAPPKRKKQKSGKAVFTCEHCQASYNTLLGWARHKLKHDENTDILCNVCGRQFSSQESMEDHKKERHPNARDPDDKSTLIHVCEICGKTLSSQGGLKIHMERHNGFSLICDECGKPCITKGDLNFHKLTHLAEKPFVCDFCPYRYNHPSNIYHHMQRDHTEPGGGFIESYFTDGMERTYACDEDGCSESFTSLPCLKHHQLYHKGVKKCGCRKCDMKFITKFDAYNHSSKVHQKVFFECEYCKKMLKGRVALESHIRYNHTNEEPFPCTKCERKFKTKGDLTYHTAAAHTGEYKFSCEVCGKKVITKGNLNAHMRVHSGARVFQCDVDGCDASFKAKSVLKRHLFKEHGRNDFAAKVKSSPAGKGWGSGNGARSAQGRPAKVYLLSRTNNPDPECMTPCDVCGKQFASATALENHSREALCKPEDGVKLKSSIIDPEALKQGMMSMSTLPPLQGNRDIYLTAAEQDTQTISLTQYIPHYPTAMTGEVFPGNSAKRSPLEAAVTRDEDASYYSHW